MIKNKPGKKYLLSFFMFLLATGGFTYHCKVHPTMTASVTVSDSSIPATNPVMTPGY